MMIQLIGIVIHHDVTKFIRLVLRYNTKRQNIAFI